jgi:ribosomal peptide maturation radical SAM protein 1
MTTAQHGLRVLLVSMPFAALERPSLGLSLLKPEVQRAGFECDVRYLAPVLAEFVGLEEYLWIHGQLPYTAFAGDWAFTSALYGPRPEVDAEYLDYVLRRTWQLDDQAVARVLRVRAYCEPFLDYCVQSIPWADYDVVGFTSTFEQNIASLALAKRVKAAFPNVLICFGGANWEDEMGRELHSQFAFVDYVCSGEADESFPALLSAIASGEPPGSVPGIVYRRDGRTVSTGPMPLKRDLDELPIADFDDYFVDHDNSPTASEITPVLLLETSRGCWWGAKNHCTFCGLNGLGMAFRSKSADRVLDEIHLLRDRYGAVGFSVVDNILDMRYFRTLLPRMEEEEMRASLFYEVKANLSHAQVRQLWASGIHHIQPGIESFSDHVLHLMNKGTTALQNIQLLKWCEEFGIVAEWNLLYGFPGEDPADYAHMLQILPSIAHLNPPTATGPIRLDRFSPYHDDPASYGMTNVRPLEPYPYLYPFAGDSLMRAAYYFSFDYADKRDPMEYARPVIAYVEEWRQSGRRGAIWQVDRDEGMQLVVERQGHVSSVELSGWQAAIYSAADRVRSESALLGIAAGHDVAADATRRFLTWGVDSGLMLEDAGRYLSLAVHRPARTKKVDTLPEIPIAEELPQVTVPA